MKEENRELIDMTKRLIVIFLLLWVTFAFILGIKMAPNDDMKPKIGAGDLLVYYRLNQKYNIRDVVVVKKNDTEYIGRIIGQEGDTINITKEANLIVNDNMVIESDIFYTTPYYEGFVEYPVTLGKNEFFILADKREGGEDSRYYGTVNKKEIKGLVIGQFRKNDI